MQMDVPSFEFVDLPGYVQFPAEANLASKKLIKKYLRNELTMCVPSLLPLLCEITAPPWG